VLVLALPVARIVCRLSHDRRSGSVSCPVELGSIIASEEPGQRERRSLVKRGVTVTAESIRHRTVDLSTAGI
jgi:hypothetical protein